MISEESKKKLLCFADWLEKQVSHKNFNMDTWITDYEHDGFVSMQDVTPECGTTCCIAGWMALADGNKLQDSTVLLKDGKYREVDEWAGEKLGLDYEEYRKLFYPSNWPRQGGIFGRFRDFPNTPKGAARRIRHFVETGE